MTASLTRVEYLTVEELATEFRTTPETVHWWIKTHKAPASVKVGRRRLFARADVNSWAEASKTSGGPGGGPDAA